MNRGCNIIRRRCIEFIKTLREFGYKNEIPLEEAKQLFLITMGIGDRKSIQAYFGSQATRSIKKIQKIARYSTGTLSFKNIELAQEIPQKKGYFELLGLAKFELRGKTCFMILTNEALVPLLVPQHYESNECSLNDEGDKGEETKELSIENFSLPPILPSHSLRAEGGEEGETLVGSFPLSQLKQTTQQTTTYRMRERNLQKTGKNVIGNNNGKIEEVLNSLTHDEKAILNAKPVECEPDKAKIKWRDVSHE